MSFIPDFEFGLFNAWLFIVPIVIATIIIFGPRKSAIKRGSDMSSYSKSEKFRAFLSTGIFHLALLYTVVVPLKFASVWIYVGIVVYLFGIIPYIISLYNFATTPLGVPVLKGVYKLSRNPMYFFSSITVLGIGISGASWILIFLILLYTVLNHFIILSEEQYCSGKYGESYLQYKTNVPRYFLFF